MPWYGRELSGLDNRTLPVPSSRRAASTLPRNESCRRSREIQRGDKRTIKARERGRNWELERYLAPPPCPYLQYKGRETQLPTSHLPCGDRGGKRLCINNNWLCKYTVHTDTHWSFKHFNATLLPCKVRFCCYTGHRQCKWMSLQPPETSNVIGWCSGMLYINIESVKKKCDQVLIVVNVYLGLCQ